MWCIKDNVTANLKNETGMAQQTPIGFLKFTPQLMTKVWGGDKLHETFGKDKGQKIGESWEISGVPQKVSVVCQGPFKGQSLTDLLNQYGKRLVGEKVYAQYGKEFPLLFKFIDACEDLSVQLHPDDALAKERHKSFGKTEMWYVLQADPGARLVIGFEPGTTMETYHKHLADHTITDILNEIPVSAGDAFFIPPGLVHAIGAGVVLAEIQQTSDVTYRLFDWDRPDDNGQMRALHIDEAEKALVFHDLAQVACTPKGLIEDQVKVVYESRYFSTSVMRLTRPIVRNYYQNDSFVVLMCTRGSLTLSSDGLALMQMRKGESVLVPAEIASIQISTQDAEILEVFVP